jgi:hypothetical protein
MTRPELRVFGPTTVVCHEAEALVNRELKSVG